MAQVARDVHGGHRHQPGDAGVLGALGQEPRDFFANGFGHPVGATPIIRVWITPAWRRVVARHALSRQCAGCERAGDFSVL